MEGFEIYEGFTGRHKKYVVAGKATARTEIIKFAKRFYKCGEARLEIVEGFLYDGQLYLDNPRKKGVRGVWVAFYA